MRLHIVPTLIQYLEGIGNEMYIKWMGQGLISIMEKMDRMSNEYGLKLNKNNQNRNYDSEPNIELVELNKYCRLHVISQATKLRLISSLKFQIGI